MTLEKKIKSKDKPLNAFKMLFIKVRFGSKKSTRDIIFQGKTPKCEKQNFGNNFASMFSLIFGVNTAYS